MRNRPRPDSTQVPLAQIDEQVLVLRSQAGDEAAFVALVRRYGSGLRYYLRQLLVGLPQREATVEDALQDVWFRVFRGIMSVREPKCFAAWLYRIARDRALLERRKVRARARHEVEASWPRGPIDPPAPAPPVEQPVLARERAELLQIALDRLPLEHRDALVLRYMAGLKYQDLAQVLGCPTGTVRSRLHHARRALREQLRRQEVVP